MADAFTSETYDALCRDAEGYLARGLAEQARELLLKATSLIGTRARARSLLADACMQLTLWDEAKSQLEALATLEVDDIYTHFRLGQVLEETSDYELAIDNFRVVLDMNADHHGAKVAIARLEKLADAPSSSEKVRPVEGQQIFADSDDENGVFAGESSQGIDELLNNIGMGEKAEVPGVDDLLNSLGMHNEEKKEEKPKVDFSSIFGGSSQAESPVVEQQSSDSSPDFASIFGGNAEPESAPEVPEEPQADLGAMFGETPKTEETVETEQPPADTSADLSSMFGGDDTAADTESTESTESTETLPESVPETVAEVPEPQADLSAMFGETPKTEETVETEQPPADTSTDLSSMFGGDDTTAGTESTESTETSPESVPDDSTESTETLPEGVPDDSTESTETLPEGVPDDSTESTETSPESVPDDSTESTETSPESVPDDSTEASPEGVSETVAEVPEEPKADLDAMFGETPKTEETVETEQPPADTSADLSSMFGGDDTTAGTESTESTEASPESVPKATEPLPGASRASARSDSTVSDEAEKSTTDDLPVEITVEVPIVSEEKTEITSGEGVTAEPEKEVASSPDTPPYTLLPGDGNSLCIMKLENAKARVIRGLIVGMDGTVSLEGDVLLGDGLVWIGQGSLTPVVVKYQEGMTVRIDRLVVRPVQIVHEACGLGSVPSLCKLNGSGINSNILMFVTGRLKKLSVSSGLRVLGGSVLVADPEVSFAEDVSGFLSVTGEGTLIITG